MGPYNVNKVLGSVNIEAYWLRMGGCDGKGKGFEGLLACC